jgi:geranylgeranyl diphosphate synthase, type I
VEHATARMRTNVLEGGDSLTRLLGATHLTMRTEPGLRLSTQVRGATLASHSRPCTDDGTQQETRYLDRVQSRLAALLQAERERWCSRYPALVFGFDSLTAFVLGGGKLLRPRFAYWGFVGAGGDLADPRLVDLGAAIELTHAFALIHDDVMDGSDVRRHQPTVHRRFAALHGELGWRGEERRVAEGFAILLGDLAFVYSTQLLCGAPPRVCELFDEMRIELHVGQYLDLVCAASGSFDDPMVSDIARFKTAKYTVERPLHLGAALAGTDVFDAALSRFGLAVGEAFQHRDDLLGVFGHPEETGKPCGDDLRTGKMTLLLQRALATPASNRGLIMPALERMGTDSFSDGDVADVAMFLIHCGAVGAVEEQIVALIDDSLRTLHSAGLSDAATLGLERLARTSAWRNE